MLERGKKLFLVKSFQKPWSQCINVCLFVSSTHRRVSHSSRERFSLSLNDWYSHRAFSHLTPGLKLFFPTGLLPQTSLVLHFPPFALLQCLSRVFPQHCNYPWKVSAICLLFILISGTSPALLRVPMYKRRNNAQALQRGTTGFESVSLRIGSQFTIHSQ